jgi:hypothetical protein
MGHDFDNSFLEDDRNRKNASPAGLFAAGFNSSSAAVTMIDMSTLPVGMIARQAVAGTDLHVHPTT